MISRGMEMLAQRSGIQRRLRWYLRKINFIRKVSINGAKIRLPSINGTQCEVSEPWMTEALKRILREQSGAFIDVGVNLGQTLIKVKALDPHREYVGFEPNPACLSYVQKLIQSNAFTDCTLVPAGLFTEDCLLTLNLYSDDITDPSASLIRDFRPEKKSLSHTLVPVLQYESMTKALGDVTAGIVKIDVEGAELEVLTTLMTLLERDKPFVILEILPVYSATNDFRKNRQNELEKILTQLGYAMFRVEKTASDDYSTLTPIKEIGVHSDLRQCDYVMMPSASVSPSTNGRRELQLTALLGAKNTR